MTAAQQQRKYINEAKERWKTNLHEQDRFQPVIPKQKIDKRRVEERTKLGMSSILVSIANDRPVKETDPDKILEAICEMLQVSVSRVLSGRRHKELVFARKLFFYVCRNLLNFSLNQCGKLMNKDHSTVIHDLKKLENEIQYSEYAFQKLVMLKINLGYS